MAPYTLYTWGTPNGWKVSILLEELGLQYVVNVVELQKGAHIQDAFVSRVNPNGKIPAIVDHKAGDLAIFESGAIMWYLCEKEDTTGAIWPKDLGKRAEVMSWLMFQMSGIAPNQGQATYFLKRAPEKIAFAMKRYMDETKRHYEVLEKQLEGREWLAAGQYTIADMANFASVIFSPNAGIDYKSYPNINGWVERINKRPAVQKGLRVPENSGFAKVHDDEEAYNKALAEMNEVVRKAEGASN